MESSDLSWVPTFTVIATALSLFATFRPELQRIFKKWIVDIDLSLWSEIEINYSTLGPTIAFLGTLHSIHGNQFIDRMSITLVRYRDRKTHVFNWAVFRKETLSARHGLNVDAEIAAAFALSDREAKRLHVVFSDSETRERLRPVLAELKNSWNEAVQNDPEVAQELVREGANIYTAFSKFREKNPDIVFKTKENLDNEMYWESGKYFIKIDIHTKRPKKVFSLYKEFYINEEDVTSLKKNSIPIILESCGVPDVIYHYGLPHLYEITKEEMIVFN